MRVNFFIIAAFTLLASCAGGGGGGGGGGGSSDPFPYSLFPTLPSFFQPLTNPANSPSASSFKTTEYNNQNGLEDIKAADAYSLLESNGKTYNGSGIKIAINDDGVRTTHQEISANYNATGDDNVSASDHGTHVASTAAGVKDGSGIHGVAFGSQIVSVDVVSDGSQNLGITTAVNAGAKVINMSFVITDNSSSTIFLDIGSSNYNSIKSQEVSATDISKLSTGDAFISIAAGNDSNHSYVAAPAVFVQDSDFNSQAVAVVAVDPSNNQIASFSNYCSQVKYYCLAAPGVSITGAIATY